MAVMLADYRMADGQAQTVAALLGGIVRIKNLGQVFLGNADSLVGKDDLDIMAWRQEGANLPHRRQHFPR